MKNNQNQSMETVDSRTGMKNSSKTPSRLSKRSLVARYQVLVNNQSKSSVINNVQQLQQRQQHAHFICSELAPYYRGLKYESIDYMMAKKALAQTFKQSGLGNWISAPIHYDLFPIDLSAKK